MRVLILLTIGFFVGYVLHALLTMPRTPCFEDEVRVQTSSGTHVCVPLDRINYDLK